MGNFSEEQNRLLDAIRKMEADGVPEDKIRQVVEYAKQKNPSLVGGKAKQQPAFSLAPPPEPKMKGALGAIEAQGIEVPTKPSGETMPDIGKEESRLGFMGRGLKDMFETASYGVDILGSYLPGTIDKRDIAGLQTKEVQEQKRIDYPKLSQKKGTDVFRDASDLDAWTVAASDILPTAVAMVSAPITGGTSAMALTGTYFGSSVADNYEMGRELGLSENQSSLYGTVMGSIEAAAENLGLDALTKIPKSWLSKTVKESVKKYGKEGAEKTLGESMKAITAWLAKRGIGVAQGAFVEGAEEGLTSLGQSGTQLAFDAATGSELFDPNKQVPQGGVVGEVLSRALEAGAGGAIGGGLIGGVRGIETRDGKTPAPAQPAVPPASPDAQIDEADLEALSEPPVPPTAPPIDPTAPVEPVSEPVEPVSEPVDPNTSEGAATLSSEAMLEMVDALDEDLNALAEGNPTNEAAQDEVSKVDKILQGYREMGDFDEEQLGLMRPYFEEIMSLDDELSSISSKEAKDSLGILKKKHGERRKEIAKRRKEIDKAVADIADGNFARASTSAVVEEDLPELMAGLDDIAMPVVAAEPEPVMGEAVTDEVVTPTEVAAKEEVVAPTEVEEKEEKVVKALRVNGVFYIDENGDVSKELRDKLDKAKSEKNLKELDDIYYSVRVVLNGPSQARGQKTVEQFKAIKSELEDFANQIKQSNKKDEKEKSANLLNWREVYKKADPYRKASILREIASSGTEKELSDVLDMLVKGSVEESNIAWEVANRTKSRETFERAVSNRALKKTTSPESIDFLRAEKFGDSPNVTPTEIATKEEKPVKQTKKKDEKEPVLEGVQGRRDEGEGRKESPELRTQEAKQEEVEKSKDFTDGNDLQRIRDEVKAKYKPKEAERIIQTALRLVNPNKNKIVKIKSGGVFVEKGDKVLFYAFSNTDAHSSKWILINPLDVTDDFKLKQEEVKSFPTEPTIEEIKKDYIQLGFNEELANKNANHLHRALSDEKFAYELLDVSNKNSRKIWSKITGLALPNTQGGSRRVIEGYFINKRNPNLANAAKLIAEKYGSLENIANTNPNEIYESIPEVDYETAENIVNGARDALIENGQEWKLKSKTKSEPTSTDGKADVGGSNTPTVSDFEAISAKGEKGRKARAELTKRLGKDTVNDMTRITANFESIINNLENQGKIRKECP